MGFLYYEPKGSLPKVKNAILEELKRSGYARILNSPEPPRHRGAGSPSLWRAKVTSVGVRIGKLSGVIPDALRFAFEVASTGGRAEGASLLIETVPVSIACNQCKKVTIMDDPFLICPHCNGSDVELIAGRELEIKDMEIEDGDR